MPASAAGPAEQTAAAGQQTDRRQTGRRQKPGVPEPEAEVQTCCQTAQMGYQQLAAAAVAAAGAEEECRAAVAAAGKQLAVAGRQQAAAGRQQAVAGRHLTVVAVAEFRCGRL